MKRGRRKTALAVAVIVISAVAAAVLITRNDPDEQQERVRAMAEQICSGTDNVFVTLLCEEKDYAAIVAWEADRRKRERDAQLAEKQQYSPAVDTAELLRMVDADRLERKIDKMAREQREYQDRRDFERKYLNDE